jgi:hypothetical protein
MTTAKTEIHNLMVEVFLMIEGLNTPEGDYLKFAELFKQMNINLDRLVGMKQQLLRNTYYIRYIRNENTVTRVRLTEEQKRKNPEYEMCNCGRYSKKTEMNNHLKTGVHFQGRRNRKYAGKGLEDEHIDFCISREVGLQAFIIRHLVTVENRNQRHLVTVENRNVNFEFENQP